MYSLVLLAALAGSGEAAAAPYYFEADPCPCCVWPVFPLGGQVVFFWAGPAALSDYEEKEWKDYLGVLDEADRSDAEFFWSRSDRAGRQLLLGQVRLMRAKKDELDRRKQELEAKQKKEAEMTPLTPELKKPEPGIKKPDADKRDKSEKSDPKKIEKKVDPKDLNNR
ncbi:MAG: hypothetical protein U0840_03330 [Gemmataceae bacterium]